MLESHLTLFGNVSFAEQEQSI